MQVELKVVQPGSRLVVLLLLWLLVILPVSRVSASAPFFPLALSLCLLTVLSAVFLSSELVRDTLVRQRTPLAWLGLWLLFGLLVLLPVGGDLRFLLNPNAEALRLQAGISTERVWLPLSMDAWLAGSAWLRSCVYALLFVLVLLLVRRRRHVAWIINALLLVAGGELLFQLVMGEAGRWRGSFANPNHFGALMAMGVGLCIGRVRAHRRRGRFFHWRSLVVASFDWLSSVQARWMMATLVLIVALLLSGSRGAIVATLVGGTLSLVLHQLAGRRRWRGLWKGAAGFALAMVLLLLLMPASLLQRFETVGAASLDEGRPAYWYSTYRMIRDYPLVGIGGGGWRYMYPVYQNPATYDVEMPVRAHNEYLQLIAEYGIVGFSLLAGFILAVLTQTFRAASRCRNREMNGVLLGINTACVVLLVHALGEFHFQNLLIIVFFYTLLATGLATAHLACASSVRRSVQSE